MVEEDFVKYEEALALKKLGFDNKCLAIYYHMRPKELVFAHVTKKGKMLYQYNSLWDSPQAGVIAVPTYHQAFKWFRDIYFLDVLVCFDNNRGTKKNPVYYYGIYDVGDRGSIEDSTEGDEYKTYEKAELECLKKLIEIAI